MTRTNRINFLDLHFDRLTFRQVKARLESASSRKPFGYVVTPNVDHMVRLHRQPGLRALYDQATFCLCDSRILRLLARLRGIKLTLVPGSDLVAAVLADVVKPGDRVAIVGGTAATVDELRTRYPAVDFIHHEPPMGLSTNHGAQQRAADFVSSAQARFSFIAVGAPQQEMIAYEVYASGRGGGVALCIGAGLEFVTGEQKRAPRLLQQLGLEWAHRLATNPRRLWRRYLVDGLKIFPLYLRWRPFQAWPLWAGLILALSALALATLYVPGLRHSPTGGPEANQGSSKQFATIQLPPPNLLRPLTPEQATQQNDERPFVRRLDTAASKFVLPGGADTRDRALTCLTQAVYYEAASEGSPGERAVAQVVLNRMHHPGFPSSVCGVVYQGSDRPTGCQFTFTCDGSLLRTPVAALWTRARKIAEDALKGKVFAPVGHATHYHADYVLPYWADSLDKTVQIGRHIFYRLRGSMGERNSFLQHYAGTEPPLPQPRQNMVLTPSSETQQLANALISDNNSKLGAPQVEKAAPGTAPILADANKTALIADGLEVPKSNTKSKPSTACPAGERKQLKPLGASDLRVDNDEPNC